MIVIIRAGSVPLLSWVTSNAGRMDLSAPAPFQEALCLTVISAEVPDTTWPDHELHADDEGAFSLIFVINREKWEVRVCQKLLVR